MLEFVVWAKPKEIRKSWLYLCVHEARITNAMQYKPKKSEQFLQSYSLMEEVLPPPFSLKS